jgi:hypothetical protein
VAIARVAAAAFGSADSNGFTGQASLDSTGANLLVAVVGDTTGVTVPSDSRGNTWTPLTQYGGGGFGNFARLYYVKSPAVGTGHTFGASGTGNAPSIAVAAYSGADTSAPFDVENGGNDTNLGNPVSTGSTTPGAINELVVSGFTHDGNGVSGTVDAGLGIAAQAAGTGNSHGAAIADIVETSIVAVNATWTPTAGTYDKTAPIAAFKPSGGAVAQTPYNPWMQRAPLLAM